MKHIKNGLLDPDMPAQTMRLHLGELTAGEVQAARGVIGWANRQIERISVALRKEENRLRVECHVGENLLFARIFSKEEINQIMGWKE